MAVDAIEALTNGTSPQPFVNLNNIRVVTRVGGTVDDSELIDGLVFEQKAVKAGAGPTRIENARIALIQF